MKELSIEEKAKRYDEAISIAKSKIKNDKDHVLYEDDVIDLFPELAESEDEKVRKALLEMIHDTTGDSLWVDYNVHKKDAIAWLEKQGKHKPLFKEGDTVIWDGEEFNILDVAKDSYNVGGYIIPIYRQNEFSLKQKSAWSEEDEDYYDAIIAKLEVTQDDALLTDNQLEFLKSLKDRYTWKPNDEQMTQLKRYCPDNRPLTSLYEQLKKLRNE